MKLKKDFVLRQVAGSWVVLPLGEESITFNGMLTLNETGAVLWQALEQGGDLHALVDALTSEYDVSTQQAQQDAEAFLAKLADAGCLEN